MITLLIGLAVLPKILLGLAIVVLFLWLLYYLISKLPAPYNEWAKTATILALGILLLLFLISIYQGGLGGLGLE
jgi:succinate dehydrogenase hydrophobic anchor subunit